MFLIFCYNLLCYQILLPNIHKKDEAYQHKNITEKSIVLNRNIYLKQVTIKHCIFKSTGQYNILGGSLYIKTQNSNNTINNCKFQNCFSKIGGSIYIHSNHKSITILEKCIFDNNKSAEKGGSIFIFKSNEFFKACEFIENYILYDKYQHREKQIKSQGGGIMAYESNESFEECIFKDNSATYGEDIYSKRSELSINECFFERTQNNTGKTGILIYQEIYQTNTNTKNIINISKNNKLKILNFNFIFIGFKNINENKALNNNQIIKNVIFENAFITRSSQFTPSITLKTCEFTSSNLFSQSSQFTPSITLKTCEFTSSNLFSQSSQFTPSIVFSQESQFTPSFSFKTFQFTSNNLFSQSSQFTPSFSFKTFQFTSSNLFSQSSQFTSSNSFEKLKFTFNDIFSHGFHITLQFFSQSFQFTSSDLIFQSFSHTPRNSRSAISRSKTNSKTKTSIIQSVKPTNRKGKFNKTASIAIIVSCIIVIIFCMTFIVIIIIRTHESKNAINSFFTEDDSSIRQNSEYLNFGL